jgi:hypothetical protein
MSEMRELEALFDRACGLLFRELAAGEALAVDFTGESSRFMRFTACRVRQIGAVLQAGVRLTYYRDGRTISSAFGMSGDEGLDAERAAAALSGARREVPLLPKDPYQVLPAASGSSREEFPGRLPDPDGIPHEVLGPGEVDLRGRRLRGHPFPGRGLPRGGKQPRDAALVCHGDLLGGLLRLAAEWQGSEVRIRRSRVGSRRVRAQAPVRSAPSRGPLEA